MKDAKAFGPYIYSAESLQMLKETAAAFKADLAKIGENPDYFDSVDFPKGFYPLCGYCEYNSACPKFKAGSFQPEWESAIQRLDELKQRQNDIHAEITAIEDSLKQAYRLSNSKDWIETGGYRFRMSMVAGRKSLNQDALKMEISDILHGLGSEVDVDCLFASCMKQSASFPRLTISTVN